MEYRIRPFILLITAIICLPLIVYSTNRYYGSYLSYGSGDTMIYLWYLEGGSQAADRKWLAECMDGEAMIGLQDYSENYAEKWCAQQTGDPMSSANHFSNPGEQTVTSQHSLIVSYFQRLTIMGCKFMFPNKPPTQGLYPYYPSCHVLDFTTTFFCYVPQNHSTTVNTFMTGLWTGTTAFWWTWPPDHYLYKCCKTPQGYYIDYVSCYYKPTRDQYWEYYDATNQMLVYCATGYVMTGMSSKISPITGEKVVEWLQCCRVGFGAPVAYPPPVITLRDGRQTIVARDNVQPLQIPPKYIGQYYKTRKTACPANSTISDGDEGQGEVCSKADRLAHNNHLRYKRAPVPHDLKINAKRMQLEPARLEHEMAFRSLINR